MRTIVNIATFKNPQRRESLIKTVNSLIDQVDEVYVWFNGYSKEEVGNFIVNFNNGIIGVTGDDFADNGKFYQLSNIKEPAYYLTADDDIIYPPNYVQKLKEKIEEHKCIITYHGRKINPDDHRYYQGKHQTFHFLKDLKEDTEIDIAGTGVMGFRTDYFQDDTIWQNDIKCASDLLFSIEAKRQGKKIICANHSRNWLKAVNLKGIWQKQRKYGEQKQIDLLKQWRDLPTQK